MNNQLFMGELGPMLNENGYNIIPVVKGTKRPALANWSRIKSTQEFIESWSPDASIGITTGDVVAIDIDCYDKHVTNAIVKYCDQHIGKGLRRVGKAPKALLVFRTEQNIKKAVSAKYFDQSDNTNCIEILGKGQQFVAFGIHPETQEEYRWPKSCPVLTPVDSLPSINEEQIKSLFEYFDTSCAPNDWERKGDSSLANASFPDAANDILSIEYMKSTLDLSDEAINNHLRHVDAEDYSQWILVGQALHHQFNGDEGGLEKWNLWSSNASSYKGSDDCRGKWKTFEAIHDGGTVTFATVIDMAKRAKEERTHKKAEDQANTLAFTPVGKIDAAALPVREWVLGHRLMKGYITAMFAPGGVSKSMFSLLSAVSVASGKPYTGEVVHRQGKVWVINNEDDEPEQLRRLAGVVKHHKIDDSILDNISLSCGYGNPYITSTVDKEGNVVHHPNAEKIIAEAKANNVNYIIFDPFISVHQSDENDNNSIQKVVDVIKHIAKEANVAIELVHHTRKATGGKESEGHAGNADAGRGASSLKDACRVITTLARISEKNSKDESIDYEHEGRFLVRLDSGKGNYSGPPGGAEWFKQVSVNVGNGDTIGAHETFDMDEQRKISDSEKRQQKSEQIAQYLLDLVCVVEDGISKQTNVIALLVKGYGASKSTWKIRVGEALPLGIPQYAMNMVGQKYRMTRAKRGSATSTISINKELVG
ncbi:MAG: AAA family ATPase [Oceanospirillaceae bacterium]|jgi:hypothetical protein|nr:AAA family ATPase [Oceanospirillaceae bacterium]MBT4444207.1 AAA family ATPase [Oceanospirillaceae bacterium]